jgi:hypothetical protein
VRDDPTVDNESLPSWQPVNEAGRQYLRDWTNRQLDAEPSLFAQWAEQWVQPQPQLPGDGVPPSGVPPSIDLVSTEAASAFFHELALVEAEWGNVEPLRLLHPEIAELIQPPRRARGRPHRWDVDLVRLMERLRLREAIDDVYRIRGIWKRRLGKWKRADSDAVTAVAIAADRHGLNQKDVHEAFKRSVGGLAPRK